MPVPLLQEQVLTLTCASWSTSALEDLSCLGHQRCSQTQNLTCTSLECASSL